MTWFKRHLTIERLVHVVIVVFAVASIGNLWEFMKEGHNVATAAGIGVALGLGLVAASIMFTKVDPNNTRTFWAMLIGMLAMGLLSGTMQTIAYSKSASLWVAILQGFGFPLIGECMLAYATALYADSERKRRAQLADEEIEGRINDSISYALASIDISSTQRYVEERAADILRHKMDAIVAKRIGVQLALPEVASVQSVTRESATEVAQVEIQTDNSSATTDNATASEEAHTAYASIGNGPATSSAQLDDIDMQIVEAVRAGHYTPYAISKVVPVALTTLKRKSGDTHVGRIPQLVAAGVLHNSSGSDGKEYRVCE